MSIGPVSLSATQISFMISESDFASSLPAVEATTLVEKAPELDVAVTAGAVASDETVSVTYTLTNTFSDEAAETTSAEDITFSHDFQGRCRAQSLVGGQLGSPCGDGSTVSVNGTTLEFSSIKLAANESCSFTIDVQLPAGLNSTVRSNTTEVTATRNLRTVVHHAAELELNPGGLEIAGDPVTLVAGETTVLVFRLSNTNPKEPANNQTIVINIDSNQITADWAQATTNCNQLALQGIGAYHGFLARLRCCGYGLYHRDTIIRSRYRKGRLFTSI